MKHTTNSNTVVGLIEYRGRILAAEVPVGLLIMDAQKFALTCIQGNRRDAFDSEFTAEERRTYLSRADALDQWVNGGCEMGGVSFDVDMTLYLRSAFAPAVVTPATLDVYLDAVLTVSKVMPLEAVDAPQFAIRHNSCEAELWLSNIHRLRSPRLHPGPDIRVVAASVDALKALIAGQSAPIGCALTTSVAA